MKARNFALVASTILSLVWVQMGSCLAQENSASGPQQLPEHTISPIQFREAVQFVYGHMLKRSPDPFQAFTEDQFKEEVERMTNRTAPITEGEAFIALSKLIGMMRDGHSWMFLDNQNTLLFSKAVPLRLWDFKDGLYVRAATPQLAELVGARVLAINDVAIESAWTKILDGVGGGGGIAKGRAPVYALMPDFLRALGIGSSNDEIAYTLELANGKIQTRTIKADQYQSYDQVWSTAQGLNTPAGWTEPKHARRAAWYAHHDEAFWYEYQPEQRTVYAQFNIATRDRDNPWTPRKDDLRPMLNEIFKRVKQLDADRLVIDLRNNRGGFSGLWQPLVHGIIRTEKLYEPARLFVIIGSETESAAVAWAAKIEGNTRAIFVGEPTASPPNFFNDPDGPRRKHYDVPNTAINFFVANARETWSSSGDHRARINPDIPVTMTWDDFASGRDPAMEAITKITPEKAEAVFLTSDGEQIPSTLLWANYLRQSQDEARSTEAWRR